MGKVLGYLAIVFTAFALVNGVAPQSAAATDTKKHDTYVNDTRVDEKAAKAVEDDAKKFDAEIEKQAKASVQSEKAAIQKGVSPNAVDDRHFVQPKDGGERHLAAVTPKAGLVFRNVEMPDDCQDPNVTGNQWAVDYVKQHADPTDPLYVPDSDVDEYICAWN